MLGQQALFREQIVLGKLCKNSEELIETEALKAEAMAFRTAENLPERMIEEAEEVLGALAQEGEGDESAD